jgi:hypothetical protein
MMADIRNDLTRAVVRAASFNTRDVVALPLIFPTAHCHVAYTSAHLNSLWWILLPALPLHAEPRDGTMRLFLLPISTRRTLIYCERSSKLTTDQKTLLDKATAKAAQIWVQWEKSNKKWQRTVTEYGNRAFQRIPFEEWGLKSIPPLSPQRRAEGAAGKKVEVTFPLTLIRPDSIGALLRKLGTERQSLHRKRMWWSIVGMPITLPMALVPV